MMIMTEEQSVVIKNLRKLIKEIDAGFGGMGNSWAVGMVIFNSYMVCVNVV